MSFSTRAIHTGSDADPTTGAVIRPISLATTYKQDDVGVHKGYDYSRSDNPNRRDFEAVLTSLENGAGTVCYSSGSAATSAMCQWAALNKEEGGGRALSEAEGHILCINDVYGGTYRYLTRVARATTGLVTTFLDMTVAEEAEIRAAILPSTKLIWLESPTNPLLLLPPIRLLVRILASLPPTTRPLLLVDNTFLSPYYCNPLSFGADVVLHSISKYINGHSDVIGGSLTYSETAAPRLAQGIRFLQNATGGIPSPFDCFLAQRGAKTLALRMREHGLSALRIASLLADSPYVERVAYPGLSTSRFYRRARSNLSQHARSHLRSLGWKIADDETEDSPLPIDSKADQEGGIPYSGMITIHLRPPPRTAILSAEETTSVFLRSLHLFHLAESLGGVESLIEAPWKMTHGSIPEDERRKAGITEGCVRISVGLEGWEDLWQDLSQGLDIAYGQKTNGVAKKSNGNGPNAVNGLHGVKEVNGTNGLNGLNGVDGGNESE